MGWLRKSNDPLEARARELDRKLARVREEMAHARSAPAPHFKSSYDPRKAQPGSEPVFEEIDPLDLSPNRKPAPQPENLAALKLDPGRRPGPLKRLARTLGATHPANPKLIRMLFEGNLQGPVPLRREQRGARNRFWLTFLMLLLVLSAVIALITRNY